MSSKGSMKDKVMKVIGKISNSRHMIALRDGIAQAH